MKENILNGERNVVIHSLTKLVSECLKRDKEFEGLKLSARILDKYYIPTRYPNALPIPAVPYEEYGREEAEEAIKYGEAILELVKRKTGYEKG